MNNKSYVQTSPCRDDKMGGAGEDLFCLLRPCGSSTSCSVMLSYRGYVDICLTGLLSRNLIEATIIWIYSKEYGFGIMVTQLAWF